MNSNQEYSSWIVNLKSTIKKRQIKAAVAVNSNLILMYWELGKQIVDKQENAKWGTGFIDQLSNDLKSEFPEISGFSRSNIFAIKKFFLFYRLNDSTPISYENPNLLHQKFPLLLNSEIIQQPVGQIDHKIIQQVAGQIEFPDIIIECCKIPWGHNLLIIEKIKSKSEVQFYIKQTIENSWSRSVLEYQIETNLYSRQGTGVNHIKNIYRKHKTSFANSRRI